MNCKEKVAVTAQILTSLGVIVAIFGLRHQISSSSSLTQWNKAEKTGDILADFNKQVVKFSDSLQEYVPRFHDKSKDPMSEQTITALLNSEAGSEIDKAKEDIVSFLNYLEYLCVLYKEDVVDHESFERSLGPLIVSAYDELKPFFKQSQEMNFGRQFDTDVDLVVPLLRKRIAELQ